MFSKLKLWNNPNRSPLSLARRLTISITLVIVLIFMLFGTFIVRSINDHFLEWDKIELQTMVDDINKIIKESEVDDKIVEKIQRLNDRDFSINLEFSKLGGGVLYATKNFDFDDIPVSFHSEDVYDFKLASLKELVVEEGEFRTGVVIVRNKGESYLLKLAIPIMFHSHYIKGLIQSLWWLTIITCILVVLVVRIAIHQGHKPLRTMQQMLQMITSENLHARIDPKNYPAELQQWCQSFNHMIERIELLFHQQSNFSADIAHELRTPITALITQTEIALKQQRSVSDYQETLYSQLEELEHLGKMVGDMLFLARIDSQSLSLHKTPLNLRDEIIDIVEYFEPMIEEKRLDCIISDIEIITSGDRALLRRAFSNLISNAIRYTPAGGRIYCDISKASNMSRIEFSNTGIGVPNEHLDKIFDRFHRIDPARQRNSAEGTGIGLSIVKSIIEVHGGKITVESAGGMTKFIIFGL